MRYSVPALSRAIKQFKGSRSKDLLRLTEAARKDAGRSWSRKTAAVLEVCIRNEPTAISTWDAVRLFAQLPPNTSDVESLLPILQRQAGHAQSAVLIVGDMAHSQGLLDTLTPEFLNNYLLCLSEQNPFRAVELWKTLPIQSKNLQTGVLLYISANQAPKAEKLVATSVAVSPAIIRRFIGHYAKVQDTNGIQKWIDSWQALTPADVNWLHHLVGSDPALRFIRLPEPLDRSILFPVRRSIGKRLQRLASTINVILAESPMLFELLDVRQKWLNSIDDPSCSTLESLALEVARTRVKCDWTAVLRLVSFNTGQSICQYVDELPAGAYAALLSRAKSQSDVTKVINLMTAVPEMLYTPECLSALAQRSPEIFLEMALPQDILETALSQHHLTALWRAGPSDEVIEWLLPLTLNHVESIGLLRSACLALLQQHKSQDIARLIHEFVVVKRLQLDSRLSDNLQQASSGRVLKLQKLPKPQSSGLSEADAKSEYEKIMSRLNL